MFPSPPQHHALPFSLRYSSPRQMTHKTLIDRCADDKDIDFGSDSDSEDSYRADSDVDYYSDDDTGSDSGGGNDADDVGMDFRSDSNGGSGGGGGRGGGGGGKRGRHGSDGSSTDEVRPC